MTIDEAIKHQKNMAEKYMYQLVLNETGNPMYALGDREIPKYEKYVEEYNQTAEWLEDYKQLTEYTSTEPYIIGYKQAIDECIRKINELTCGCTQEVWSHTICNVLEELKGAD